MTKAAFTWFGWGAIAGLITLTACAPLPTRTAPAAASPAAHRAADQPTRALGVSERQRLLEGHSVSQRMEFDEGGGHYVGGTSYQLVDAPPLEVLRALHDPDRLAEMLPYTRAVREIEPGGGRRRLEVTQGNDLVEATYTIEVEEDLAAGEYRFWLEPSRPHDIDDVWGYFRVQPFDQTRSLITVAVALDVGPGIVRMLFEDRIADLILATPSRMRAVLERDPARVAASAAPADERVARQP